MSMFVLKKKSKDYIEGLVVKMSKKTFVVYNPYKELIKKKESGKKKLCLFCKVNPVKSKSNKYCSVDCYIRARTLRSNWFSSKEMQRCRNCRVGSRFEEHGKRNLKNKGLV